jgi:hypothetical protein
MLHYKPSHYLIECEKNVSIRVIEASNTFFFFFFRFWIFRWMGESAFVESQGGDWIEL